jgi:hypothetical protein
VAKISLDLMGETYREAEVNCFTIPGPGVCVSIKTDRTEVELDLPDMVFEKLVKGIAGLQKKS